MPASELAGVWRLVSFHDVDDEGNRGEGPLGPAPRGLLFYSADGYVSVTMMRAPDHGAPNHDAPDQEPGADGGPRQDYMSYAGTWRRSGGQVFHALTVAPDPGWLGTEQVRDLRLDGDRLTLTGNALSRPGRRILQWQRTGRP